MVIKFLFCKISLPRTSGCMLIDISNLAHFLCCNLFVMSCLTSSANSNFHECFGNSLTITVNYPVQMVNAITNTLLTPCYSDFSRMFSKLAWAILRYYFYEVFYPFFQTLWATAWRSVAILANFANVLKTRIAV